MLQSPNWLYCIHVFLTSCTKHQFCERQKTHTHTHTILQCVCVDVGTYVSVCQHNRRCAYTTCTLSRAHAGNLAVDAMGTRHHPHHRQLMSWDASEPVDRYTRSCSGRWPSSVPCQNNCSVVNIANIHWDISFSS